MLFAPAVACLQRKRVLSVRAAFGRGIVILVQLEAHTDSEMHYGPAILSGGFTLTNVLF